MNMNKYTGILGVFNCQGAAWNMVERKNTFHQNKSEPITGYLKGRDVHLISETALDSNWNGNVAFYFHRTGEVITLPYNVAMPVSLKVLEHEIYTVTPIKELGNGFGFAQFGLIDMFTTGGAIEGLKYEVKEGAELIEIVNGNEAGETIKNLNSERVAIVSLEVKGCGRFGAYSSTKPRKCMAGSSVVEFEYDPDSRLMTLSLLEMPSEEQKVHNVEIEL